jgi:N-6 DNA methylase
MNLAIRGIEANIAWNSEGSFHNDAHKDLKADFILANRPFNDSDWGGERLREDARWKYGLPPAGNANFAWVQHFISHLAPNGIAGFVLANGSISSNQSGTVDTFVLTGLSEGQTCTMNSVFLDMQGKEVGRKELGTPKVKKLVAPIFKVGRPIEKFNSVTFDVTFDDPGAVESLTYVLLRGNEELTPVSSAGNTAIRSLELSANRFFDDCNQNFGFDFLATRELHFRVKS